MRMVVLVLVLAACGPGTARDDDADAGTHTGPDAAPHPPVFPADPIIDQSGGALPGTIGELFGPPGSGNPSGGPCLVSPEVGSLFPRNFLRLLVQLVPGAGNNVFEIRLHAAGEPSDLVVYTMNDEWKMDAAMWQALTTFVVDQPITISTRGATWDGATLSGIALGSSGNIEIAPVSAPGAIVYWTTSSGTALKGFDMGEETVHDVLRPADVGTGCIGCHASTPDGQFIGVSASINPDGGNPARMAIRSLDGTLSEPDFITASARNLMARLTQLQPVFSPAHWSAGDHVAVGSYQVNGVDWQLIWTDLEASSEAQGSGWGVLARSGDPNHGVAPAFSHDGNEVAYLSAADTDGENAHLGFSDLYTVPFNARAGGTATPLAGASDPSYAEVYPSYAPDDHFIAFSRVPAAQSSVNNPLSEVFVVPRNGGTATRLAANDPPACRGFASPGVTNSWPKWAPQAVQSQGSTYYWVTFSSTRGLSGVPQLYVAGILVDETGTVFTTPALYLWNQPSFESNHTPAWDVFDIPID